MRSPSILGRLRPSPFVCRSCRAAHGARNLSTSHPPAPPTPPTAGLATLSSRRLISVWGPDAARYLQGVITASITTPDDARPRLDAFYTTFLNAQGRVLHDVFIYPDTLAAAADTDTAAAAAAEPGQRFLVEVDAAEAERLERHIRRYKLRARFGVRLLDPAEATVWHAWDDGAASSPPPPAAAAGPTTQLRLRDPRAPGLGTRFVTARGRRPAVDADAADESAYRVRRYLLGVPEGQAELLHAQALPLESNADVMGAVDFRKGCYVGQELTIRTRHRGVVRKRVLPCLVYPEDRAPPSVLAYRPADAAGDDGAVDAAALPAETSIGRAGRKGRSAGRWLCGVGNVGLALCRLETMTDIILPGETAAGGGYSPEDEFVMAGSLGGDDLGFSVKVKAFVPDWLRKALAEQTG